MKVRYTVLLGGFAVFLLALLLGGAFFLTVSQGGGCILGMFTCSRGDTCVPQRAVCNGYEDCEDGEDESSDVCSEFYGSTLLLDLMRNIKFNLSAVACDNVTGEFSENAGIPHGCFCQIQYEQLIWVHCKELNLTSIPVNRGNNITRLILANNSISIIPDDAFNSYSLELIHLEGNMIEDLPPTVFQNQQKIKKILLMGNKLKTIDGQLFKGLENLSILYLQRNKIIHLAEDAFRDLVSLRLLDLSENLLKLEDGFPIVPFIADLLLESNNITKLKEGHFKNISSVHYLALRDNLIQEIHPESFADLKNLKELDLSHNRLTVLADETFAFNQQLNTLFLGFNPALTVNSELFMGIPALAALHLEALEINEDAAGAFSELKNVHMIYFTNYYYCTFVPQIRKCAPRTDGLSTFKNLLGKKSLCSLVWFVSAATFIGNIFVIWRRKATRDENRSLSLLIRNLAASDFLMGIYLLIIGWKDVEFRGVYLGKAHEWMTSWTCSFAGVLAMISSEVSIMILVFISVERFLLIALPFNGYKALNIQSTQRVLAAIWICGCFIALFPMLLYRNSTRFYGANGMCFPLHLDDPFFAGWEVSAFIFLFCNSLGMAVLAILYTAMLISVWQTRHANNTISNSDFEFAVRFFFIVLTNTACWLPVIILKILATYRIYVPGSVYAFIAVAVIPVNSAFNPFLYTVTTPRYREVFMRAFQRRFQIYRRKKRVASLDTSTSNATNRHSSLDTNGASHDEISQTRLCQLSLAETSRNFTPRNQKIVNLSCNDVHM